MSGWKIKGKKESHIFRYEAGWALEEDSEEVVQRAWDEPRIQAGLWENLELKLGGCRKTFVQWQQKKRDPTGTINDLKKRLLAVKGRDGMLVGEEEKKLSKEI
jgi:hypothetical protein